MALILNIDTAQELASVSLYQDGDLLQLADNASQRDHASWLHVTLREIMDKAGYSMKDLSAVAVSIGPGSYTGLRIGLSSAKGLCYALNIPLISINTLTLLAFAVEPAKEDWICPMVDARRMEVFIAIYDKELNVIRPPMAMIIDSNSFNEILSNHNLIFCGPGSKKLQMVLSHPNATYSSAIANAAQLGVLSTQYFLRQQFADLAYTEPLYLKDFHTTHKPAR